MYYKDHKIDKNGHLIYKLDIPWGNYSSPRHLVRTIQNAIETRFAKLDEREEIRHVQIGYLDHAKRVRINFKDTIQIQFNDNLYKRLGGDPKVSSQRYITKEVFPYGVDLNMGMNHLYIYSDLVEYNNVGHIQAPLLRIVPFKTANQTDNDNGNQYQHHEFLNLHYLPIAKSEFDTIHINIRGDTGEKVHFTNGKSVVKLHFRPRQ